VHGHQVEGLDALVTWQSAETKEQHDSHH